MKRYIEQLINDMHLATSKIKPPHEICDHSKADPDNEVELEDISYVEQYLYGDKLPISEITGIATELLPSAELLSHAQQAQLAYEMEKLLNFFHFHLDFPENYPLHLRYIFIRKFWNENHVALSFGENHIEFCDYEEDNCPFPGYCNHCREFAEEINYDIVKSNHNLDPDES